jgi:hypothetical protein
MKVLGVLLLVLLASVAEAGCQNGVCIVADTGNPSANGTDLQSAINSAALGDTILLTAGATYQGQFTLPNKGVGTNPITIRPALEGLPADGMRLNPTTYANGLALLRGVGGGGGGPTLSVQNGAHHYTLIGLDISTTGDTTPANYMPDLIGVGNNYPTIAQLLATTDVVFDRVFVHPAEITSTNLVNNSILHRTSGRGFGINGIRITIKNSYIAGFTGYFPGSTTKIDSYGIYCTVGPGPLTITNNYIEAGFNNIFLGGSDTGSLNTATLAAGATTTQAVFSSVSNLNIGDYIALLFSDKVSAQWGAAKVTAISGTTVTYQAIGPTGLSAAPFTPGQAQWRGLLINGGTTIRGNTLYKQPQWAIDFVGLGKSFIEIKQVDGALIDGNLFDGSSVGASMIAMTARNQSSASPWMTIKNVTISNNLLTPAAAAWIALQLIDNDRTSTPGSNIKILNNLMPFTAVSAFHTAGGDGVVIAHNTLYSNGSAPIYNIGPAAILNGQQWGVTNTIVRDNILSFGLYGFNGNSANGYQGAWPPNGITEQKNVVINDQGGSPGATGQMPNSYIVTTAAAVGFVNVTNADAAQDYHGYALASTSPFKGRASDGTDPGVDFGTLDAALSGSATTGSGAGGLPAPTNLTVK